MRFLIIFSLCFVVFSSAFAGSYDGIFGGQNGHLTSLEDVVGQLQPGQILLIGEVHDSANHHLNQVKLIKELENQGLSFSVGMEFIEYPAQYYLDLYLLGLLDKDGFLKQIRWKGFPFEEYENQVLSPLKNKGWTYGLNVPREITSYIAKNGIKNLPAAMKRYIPQNFKAGNVEYFERFKKVMMGEEYKFLSLAPQKDEFQLLSGGHVGEDQLINYFIAQSLWDDSMATQAIEVMKQNPDTILVIIVGEFHVQYGGGLEDRLRARGFTNVVSISQVEIPGPEDYVRRNKAILPHQKYGERADFVWSIQRQR